MLQPWYKPWVSKRSLREVISLIQDTFRSASDFIDDLPEGTFSTTDAREADFLIDAEGEVFVSDLSELQKFFLVFGIASLSLTPFVVVDIIVSLRDADN